MFYRASMTIKTLYYPTYAQILDTIRIIIKYLKIFKIVPTFYVSSFRRVVVMIAILLGISPAPGCC